MADEHLRSIVVPAVLTPTSVDERNHVLCQGIYNYFAGRFGLRKVRRKLRRNRQTESRKSSESSLADFKRERNSLRRQLRSARKRGLGEETIKELAAKFHKLLRKHQQVTKAEQRSVEMNTARKQRERCAKSFHSFVKEVLDQEDRDKRIDPAFDVALAQSYFRDVYSSDRREFQCPDWLPTASQPLHPFDEGPLTHAELDAVLRRLRAGSSPSPLDQISYQIIRRCPSLRQALLALFNQCWEQRVVPRAWKEAVVRLIPKPAAESSPEEPGNFRPNHVLGRFTRPC